MFTPIQPSESNSVEFQKQMEFFNEKVEKLGSCSEGIILLGTFNFPGSTFYYKKQNCYDHLTLESIKIHKNVIKNLKAQGINLYGMGHCTVNTMYVKFGLIYDSNFFEIECINRPNTLMLSRYSLKDYYDRGYNVTEIG